MEQDQKLIFFISSVYMNPANSSKFQQNVACLLREAEWVSKYFLH